MPKFEFQLDGVLRQRRQMEQQRQREVAVAQSEMNSLEEDLRELNELVEASIGDLRHNHLVGRIDMEYLAGHRRFLIGTQRKALGLIQRIGMAHRRVEEAQKALLEAAKNRKIIERLREKHHERWLAALSRRELSEQDEIGMRLSYLNLADGGDLRV
jgi:flagellar protein FliJ